MSDINRITGEIVDTAYRIHSELGPGLLETVYETVLERALARRGLRVERQKRISFEFDGMRFEDAFCVDLLVEDRVVVELKSVEKLAPVHAKQVLTYLRLLDLPIGLLINFGAARIKDGIQRIANPRATTAPDILGTLFVPGNSNLTQSSRAAEQQRKNDLFSAALRETPFVERVNDRRPCCMEDGNHHGPPRDDRTGHPRNPARAAEQKFSRRAAEQQRKNDLFSAALLLCVRPLSLSG